MGAVSDDGPAVSRGVALLRHHEFSMPLQMQMMDHECWMDMVQDVQEVDVRAACWMGGAIGCILTLLQTLLTYRVMRGHGCCSVLQRLRRPEPDVKQSCCRGACACGPSQCTSTQCVTRRGRGRRCRWVGLRRNRPPREVRRRGRHVRGALSRGGYRRNGACVGRPGCTHLRRQFRGERKRWASDKFTRSDHAAARLGAPAGGGWEAATNLEGCLPWHSRGCTPMSFKDLVAGVGAARVDW